MNEINPILEIEELRLEYRQDLGIANVLNGVNISLDSGKSIGVVGRIRVR
jgi:ABC-type glutathione transport system ATPase component